MRSRPSGALRLGAVLGLVLLYGLVLRPARPLLTHVLALPVFEALDTPRAQNYTFDVWRGGLSVLVFEGDPAGQNERKVPSWTAPPGLLFLLPALFLIGAFPRQPLWLVLLGFHLGLAVLQVGVLSIGVGWSDAMLGAYAFTQTYGVETIGLAVPALLYIRARSTERPPGGNEAPAPSASGAA